MTAAETLGELRSLKIGVRCDQGYIFLADPESVCSGNLAIDVAENKRGILYVLNRRLPVNQDRPAHEIWLRSFELWASWMNEQDKEKRT